jgi:hypothetical protein
METEVDWNEKLTNWHNLRIQISRAGLDTKDLLEAGARPPQEVVDRIRETADAALHAAQEWKREADRLYYED